MSANAFDRDYEPPHARLPLRARQTGVRAALGMGVGASVILAIAALMVRPPAEVTPVAEADLPAAAEPTEKIAAKAGSESAPVAARTAVSFDIDAPEFAREKKTVSVREAEEGGARVDSLTVGQFGLGGSFLRVDVHQDLDSKTTNPDFFLDMTRHAQQVGLSVAKIGARSALTTRFGPFETADIRLSQPEGEGAAAAERACLATRLVDPRASLEIAGIACGAATKPIDRFALGCILDKLSYSSGGDSKALNDFFLAAELARGKGCENVSREDVTGSLPPRKATPHAKSAPRAQKGRGVAHSSAVHPEAAKN
jgi:hypothetical protein